MRQNRENDTKSPKAKRARIAKPLQPLSLPVLQDHQNNINRQIKRSRSQEFLQPVENHSINNVAGVVKKIELINFMCHSHFEISLNPRINFISGVNGSGKSAIQTGIAIGLGGTASKTNRSAKIEGLIKHGCNSGSIIITMSNTGPNAFKYSDYGDEIRIVRNISKSSSSYRIYNAYGKLVSNKKQELDSILLKFKIQPNNPVGILNQDMARNFLSTNKAENKYAMFKKATLLDEAEIMLNNIVQEIANQKELIEFKQEIQKTVENEIGTMSQKIELQTKLKEAKAKKFQLNAELMWGEVNVDKRELDKLRKICDEQDTFKKQVEDDISHLENEILTNEEKIKDNQNKLDELRNENRTREENIEKVRTEHRLKKKKYEDKCVEYQKISATIKAKKSDKNLIQSSLDEVEREELEQKFKKEEAKKKIENLNNDLLENESKVKIIEEEIRRLQNTCSHFYEKKKEKERTLYKLKEEIEGNKRQISSLKKSDDLSIYGSWMQELVNRINESVKLRKFHQPPKGPLGRYIKVKDEKWTKVIESHLGGGFLCSFFVHDKHDRDELYKIMNQVVREHKPTVHCSQFQERERNDVLPRIETICQNYKNMFRALSINDTVVSNFLMDARNIHQILLVDEKSVCRQLSSNDDLYPKNCKRILDVDAGEYLIGYKYYANMRPLRSTLLQKNTTDYIRYIEEDINAKMSLISQGKTELEDLNANLKANSDKVEEMKQELRKYRELVARYKRQISELRNIIEMEMPSLQTKIDELNSITDEIEQLEKRKQVAIQEQETYSKEMNRVKQVLNNMGCGDSMVQQTELSTEIEDLKKKVHSLNMRKQNLIKKRNEQCLKIQKLESRMDELNHKIETQSQSARDLVDEPDVQEVRTPQEIREELRKTDSFIVEAERKIGNETIDFEKNYWIKKKKYMEFCKIFTELKKMHNKYSSMAQERRTIIENLRDLCSNVILTQFETVLRSRNYKGQLQFDHNRGKLDILMAPADSGENFMNTESLSGGEKSFSTVAFLMALWSNMDLPFYSMDEYDVFMDAINRRTITGLLTSFACDKSTRQFIFLTPLDVSLIQTGPNVAVHRVKK